MNRKRRIFGVITILALALLQVVPAYALCLCLDASNCLCSRHIEEQQEADSCCVAPEEAASDASCAMAEASLGTAFAAKGCDKHSVDVDLAEAVLPAVKVTSDDHMIASPLAVVATDNTSRAAVFAANTSVQIRTMGPPTYISHLALLI